MIGLVGVGLCLDLVLLSFFSWLFVLVVSTTVIDYLERHVSHVNCCIERGVNYSLTHPVVTDLILFNCD